MLKKGKLLFGGCIYNLDMLYIIYIINTCVHIYIFTFVDYILITNFMHQLLFIHKIIFSSTCFEPQVLIFRRIQLYTSSIWYCHCLKTPTNNLPPPVSSHSSCVPTGHHELSQRVTVPYAACAQLYPPEDEHLRLETCKGEYYFLNK